MEWATRERGQQNIFFCYQTCLWLCGISHEAQSTNRPYGELTEWTSCKNGRVAALSTVGHQTETCLDVASQSSPQRFQFYQCVRSLLLFYSSVVLHSRVFPRRPHHCLKIKSSRQNIIPAYVQLYVLMNVMVPLCFQIGSEISVFHLDPISPCYIGKGQEIQATVSTLSALKDSF